MDTIEMTASEQHDYIIWHELYMKGDDLQKLSVIQALPQLLKTDTNATINRIIPKIQQELPTSSSEFHIVTSRIFRVLIEAKSPVNLTRAVLQGIEVKDPVVSSAWIETLVAVIQCLPEATVKSEVLPCAIGFSQLSRAVYYRVASTRILGQIAIHPNVTAFEVKKDVLPLVQSLTQDCFYEVRAAMCVELPNIAKGLGSDNVVKSSLLPGLVELSTDENMSVRSASVDAVVLMVPYLNKDTIRRTIIPLVKQLCIQSGKDTDRTFPVIARVYGMLLHNLQDHLTVPESVWFLDFFQHLSKIGLNMTPDELELDPVLGVSCREYCAYNLPAVTRFTMDHAFSEIQKWCMIFKNLAGDPCYLVRKTVAGCIHEVTRILGKENKCIVNDMVRLLRDEAEEVLSGLVPRIGATLELLASTGILTKDNTTQQSLDVGRALLKCQLQVFQWYNWRRKLIFLEQLEHLPNCMASDFIHQHFTPMVLKITLDGKARPVRSQAARTMLLFLRYNVKENHRKWIRENLIGMLCSSRSCYTRLIFINMCTSALEIFSRKYFKEHFYLPLLGLAEDPVSNVRLCVVNLAPTLKQILLLPMDRNLQIKLENVFSKMEMMEKDKDVVATLKRKLKEMRTTQVVRPDVMMEEKRRQDEEEKISQGKPTTQTPRISAQTANSNAIPREAVTPAGGHHAITVVRSHSLTRKPAVSSGASLASASDMSFLGQHFYIDAGVVLPEKVDANKNQCAEGAVSLEENMSDLKLLKHESHINNPKAETEMVLSTVSLENTNIDDMSDEDLKKLETSTTNITDDVKFNIQRKTLWKSSLPADAVRKRNKRFSCVFSTDQIVSPSSKATFNRRSLNLGPNEQSKIPVCFKTIRTGDEKITTKKSKLGSAQVKSSGSSISNVVELNMAVSRLKLALKSDNSNDVHTRNYGNGNVKASSNNIRKGNVEKIVKLEVKENVPLSNSIKNEEPNLSTKESNVAKVSNLPVLIRRTQSEVRK